MTEYLNQLNQAQREAVETIEGPVLVLAGAGTGKTRVLTTRFAHILLTGKAYPNQILAVTFTNKASKEMSERIAHLIQQPVDGLWLGSFHKICAKMLRINAHLVGLTSNFTILDTDDQIRLLKQIIPSYPIDVKTTPPQLILGTIQSWKDKGYSFGNLPTSEKNTPENIIIQEIYHAYQVRLQQLNACDFGDLMLHVFNIFNQHLEILQKYQRYFKYILVDEYQDTNTIQYLWLRLLAQRSDEVANICCVGDDDQSIYSWRGAEVANILRFEKDFPNAKIIRLEENYRSTQHILGAASELIDHNSQRLGKTLQAANETLQNEKVHIASVWDSDEESRLICDQIIALQKDGHQYGDMAILMRTGSQTRPFEERMIMLGLPYKIIGGLRFYERAEIRDAIAYMRIVAQPNDNLALERIINVPRRGVGSVALQKIHMTARELDVPMLQAVDYLLINNQLKGKIYTELTQLMNQLDQTRKKIETEGHVSAIDDLLNTCGYIDMWKQDKSPEAAGRLENIKELFQATAEFPTLVEFLEHISLIMDNDDLSGDDKVNLMTLHAAKGLEFNIVFLPGWEEGLFPSQRTMDESGNYGLEEERRLAYVGITRAKQRLFISHAANRQIYGQWQSSIPSRFVEELSDKHTKRTSHLKQSQNRSKRNNDYYDRYSSPKFSAESSQGTSYTQSKRSYTAPQSKNIPVGSRVFHQKFGHGTVLSTENNKLEVDFDKSDIKHVIDSFVTLES
ncbi:Superfamily I DNA or RNA helicase (UvrD) (PDB:6PPR) [Commensalibacter communis]|uniref:DNA 3'-5' helicase n=1 Tax=Commensalibacter communis TaxID=2972786 RepID=A0A9W4TNM1_9PROT|nr:UvrD-helicase domain-containing protein [Commensalibacter communis]CAI3926275.1 Superfamily I DNA or RNA helicase (UvrD) (PDB:6PPR) [Commensalibacter communis]CAI3926849.1 Superfamily I DNA or RNA helicase (UvrD) (PDB:6PPR) [Commensalibacter communis]CAI3934563.1 Superfamily I DNA or RNA helicase (UvrD) (PDB:6PPR) [Commensalibacter communis]CAI3936184.1 Superfamily I DNA or RNA helicase (UvrD) (PDB:6PPR) [Commensalibacter communis]